MHSLGCVRSARNAALFIAAGLSALAAPKAAAQDPTPWVVALSQGDATLQVTNGAALPVAAGAVLVEGTSVRTGADGRLVVAHGNDRMTVSANSAFSIPRSADPATGPSILQTLGTLLFKVEHTPGRRFEVDTPYLAAVVKGTVFTVSINGGAQIVHVAEGAVEVSAALSHAAVLIQPGQTATLSSPSGTPAIIDAHPSSSDPAAGSKRGDATPTDQPLDVASESANAAASKSADGESDGKGNEVAPGDKRADLTSEPADAAPGKFADGGTERLTHTLGREPLDVSALTNGLVKPGKDLQAQDDDPAFSDLASDAPPALPVPTAMQGAPSAPVGGASPNVPLASTPPALAATPGASPNVPLAPAATPVPATLPVNLPIKPGAAPTAFLPGPNSPIATGRSKP
jgi:hypothetical protein